MTSTNDIQIWRWAAILLLGGGIIFWIGACTPPYKQWMTKDTSEYLYIIYNNQINWYFIAGSFLVGIIISLFGMRLLSIALQSPTRSAWAEAAFAGYSFATVFWVLNIAFRVTVTMWAATQLAEKNVLDPAFQIWKDWSGIIFAVYMVLAYFSIGMMGMSLLDNAMIPNWAAWVCIVFGFAGSVLYIVRFPFFDPPLMVHTPLIILGIVILLKVKQ